MKKKHHWLTIRLRNRRICGRVDTDGTLLLWYRRWSVTRGIIDSQMRLTKEAAEATMILLFDMLQSLPPPPPLEGERPRKPQTEEEDA